MTPTSQASSTKRGDCPNHRGKMDEPPPKDDGNTGGGSGSLPTPQSVQVAG
jgi:hypothetical protein